jgi:hypothetical protein
MDYNLSREQMNINNLKEMYESNNRLLTSIAQQSDNNFITNNSSNLINNLIRTNNEIKQSIINLLNTNTNNRTHNNNNNNRPNYHSNRSHNNNNNNNINNINRPNYHSNRQNYLNNPTISNLFHTFFDPIEIFPTPSQIESATMVTRFGDIIEPINSACPISLENFNDNDRVLIIRHCNHIFNRVGLISWFRTSCRCPVCRYDIRNHVSTNTNNISDLSGNVNLSSSFLPSTLTSVERSSDSNELVEMLFNSLLGTNVPDISGNNAQDISGNNVSFNLNTPHSIYVNNDGVTQTYATDISGNNLLHFFFRS